MLVRNINKEDLNAAFSSGMGITPDWTIDRPGNWFGWIKLDRPELLTTAAEVLKKIEARLATITAYSDNRDDPSMRRSIIYSFILNDTFLNVTIPTYDLKDFKPVSVPSITSLFKNADWNEREFKEMFNIDITGHPNPKRLFLDERLDAGIMNDLVPFSTMVNGASSRDLWEKVMGTKHAIENIKNPAIEGKPAFTPVSSTAPTEPIPESVLAKSKEAAMSAPQYSGEKIPLDGVKSFNASNADKTDFTSTPQDETNEDKLNTQAKS